MADEADAAQRVENLQRTIALEAMRRTVQHLAAPLCCETWCQGCGCDIPEERLAIVPGATRCTQCQQLYDNQNRSGR